MSSWSGKSKGNVFGYKIFVFSFKYAGLGTAYFILMIAAFYYLLFSWKSSSSQMYYFRKRLHYSLVKSIISIYRNYYLFGQTLVDRVYVIAGFNRSNFTFTSHGVENLHKIGAGNKGGILISAHNGNWELAGHFLSIKAKINIVLFEGEHEKVKHYLDGVKKGASVNVIVVNNNSLDHIYKINEAIERKEFLCIHGDRFVPGTKTVSCKFLGEDALFPLGPFSLAAQLQVPVSFVYAMKQTKSHYNFFASEPVVCNFDSNRQQRDAEVLKVLHAYVVSLEKMIEKYPLQWYNYYPFWKTI
jgi:predicted LPLAT superfamily acyltransferase